MQHADLVLTGAWQGKPGSPRRTFRGLVSSSRDPRIAVSERAEVSYEAPSNRHEAGAPQAHGRYRLKVGGQTFALLSFQCPEQVGSGSAGQDDTQEAEWHVALLPVG